MSAAAAGNLSVPATDTGLRCPSCGYNLTGLTASRCPECGEAFDWEAVRQAADPTPTIAFERARGWRRVPAFFRTALTVLFTPWVFAQQVVRRARVRSALLFAAICFAATALTLVFEWAPDIYLIWMLTAVAYLPVQVVALTLLDVPGWRRPLRTLGFWLIVSGYTSAIMLTEIYSGPPLLSLDDLLRQIRGCLIGVAVSAAWVPSMWEPGVEALIGWVQLTIWVAGPACCLFARWRAARQPRARGVIAALLLAAVLIGLYGAAIDYVATPLTSWLIF